MDKLRQREVVKVKEKDVFNFYFVVAVHNNGYYSAIKLSSEKHLDKCDSLNTGFMLRFGGERKAAIFNGIKIFKEEYIVERNVGMISEENYNRIVSCFVSYMLGRFTQDDEGYEIEPYFDHIPNDKCFELPIELKPGKLSLEVPTTVKPPKKEEPKKEPPKEEKKEAPKKNDPKKWDQHNTDIIRARELELKTRWEAEMAEMKSRQEAAKATESMSKVDEAFYEKYKAYIESESNDDRLTALYDLFAENGMLPLSYAYRVLIEKKDAKLVRATERWLSKEEFIRIKNSNSSELLSIFKDLKGSTVSTIRKKVRALYIGQLPNIKKQMSESVRSNIMADLNNGVSVSEIASKYGYHASTVYQVKNGYDRRQSYYAEEDKFRIARRIYFDTPEGLEIINKLESMDIQQINGLITGIWDISDDEEENLKYRFVANTVFNRSRIEDMLNPGKDKDMEIAKKLASMSGTEIENRYLIPDQKTALIDQKYCILLVSDYEQVKQDLKEFSLDELIEKKQEPFYTCFKADTKSPLTSKKRALVIKNLMGLTDDEIKKIAPQF